MSQFTNRTELFNDIDAALDEFRMQPDKANPQCMRVYWKFSAVPPERWKSIFVEDWSRQGYWDPRGGLPRDMREAKFEGLFLVVVCSDQQVALHNSTVIDVARTTNVRYRNELETQEVFDATRTADVDERKRRIMKHVRRNPPHDDGK